MSARPVTRWGPWTLDRARLVLDLEIEGRWLYEVDLERCATAAAVLDWLTQAEGKTWASADVLGHLLSALCDLLDPQARLCRGQMLDGDPDQFDAIRERIVAAEIETRAHRLLKLRQPWSPAKLLELRQPCRPVPDYSLADYDRWYAEAERDVRGELGIGSSEGAR